MENVATYDPAVCDLCSSTASATLVARPLERSLTSDGRVVRRALRKLVCTRCGLVRDGWPATGDALADYYATAYTLNTLRDEEHVYYGPAGPVPRSQLIADWILSLLPPGDWPAGGRALEVGCGQGNLLHRLAERLPRCEWSGVELSAAAVERARARGLNVARGDLSAIAGDAFDCIVAFGVLEHVPSPSAFLAALHARLATGGRLVLGQPAADVPGYDLFFIDHLHHFARGHIEAYARRIGFELIAGAVGHPLDSDMSLYVLRHAAAPATIEFPTPVPTAPAESVRRYEALFARVDARLSRLGSDARCAVFGVGEVFALLWAYTRLPDFKLLCGLDDDVERQRNNPWPFPVVAPEQARAYGVQRVLLCVNPVYRERVAARLGTLGLACESLLDEDAP